MARNKVFKRKYIIEIKGITTNRFMEKFIDAYIGRTILALANRFASVEILLMTAEEINTTKELQKIYQCPKCGAHKYTEGATCLFCAAEGDHANSNIRP